MDSKTEGQMNAAQRMQDLIDFTGHTRTQDWREAAKELLAEHRVALIKARAWDARTLAEEQVAMIKSKAWEAQPCAK